MKAFPPTRVLSFLMLSLGILSTVVYADEGGNKKPSLRSSNQEGLKEDGTSGANLDRLLERGENPAASSVRHYPANSNVKQHQEQPQASAYSASYKEVGSAGYHHAAGAGAYYSAANRYDPQQTEEVVQGPARSDTNGEPSSTTSNAGVSPAALEVQKGKPPKDSLYEEVEPAPRFCDATTNAGSCAANEVLVEAFFDADVDSEGDNEIVLYTLYASGSERSWSYVFGSFKTYGYEDDLNPDGFDYYFKACVPADICSRMKFWDRDQKLKSPAQFILKVDGEQILKLTPGNGGSIEGEGPDPYCSFPFLMYRVNIGTCLY